MHAKSAILLGLLVALFLGATGVIKAREGGQAEAEGYIK